MSFYSDKKIEQFWEELGYAPFDEDDDMEFVLAEDWFIFSKGCDREFIWHWFDEHYSKGLYKLMFPNE